MKAVNLADFVSSKSLHLRALVAKSFSQELEISYASCAEDVLNFEKCIQPLVQENYHVGQGAAPLRFLAIRLSREQGSFEISGSERLFARPQDELVDLLSLLGCKDIVLGKSSLKFRSIGQWPRQVQVSAVKSSQMLSALLLSSWALKEDFEIHVSSFKGDELPSSSYLKMTVDFLRLLGMNLNFNQDKSFYLISKEQKIKIEKYVVEPDMSSIAILAFMGAVELGVCFSPFPETSLQGDEVVFEILKKSGVSVELLGEVLLKALTVHPCKNYSGLNWNLRPTPDLFPALACFLSKAQSASVLSGLENLNFKESKRLDLVAKLLNSVGVKTEKTQGTFKIFPVKELSTKKIVFNPEEDHRMAMAAALLNAMGAKIEIQNPTVVNKSFPHFWHHT
jgi:3-phosphoshikimate 1-carboxyvinyltransferase